MDFWDLGRLLLRRWYVALPMLLVTMGVTGYTAVEVKPDYVLTSYIQLIPPTAASDPNQVDRIQNPWIALGLSSLNQAATLGTQDQTFLNQLTDEGVTGSFAITMGEHNPVAIIAVVAPTLDQAEQTTTRVITQYETSVRSLQSNYAVRQQDMITTQRLDHGENLKRPGGKVKRAMIMVLGTGLMLTVGLTVIVDALVRRRRRAQASHDQAGTPETSTEPPTVALTTSATAVATPQSRSTPSESPHAESRRTPAVGTAPKSAPSAPPVPDDATIVLPRARSWADQDDRGRR